MKARLLLAMAAVAAFLAVPALAATSTQAMPELDRGVVAAVNAVRAEHGLRPVRLSRHLAAAAGAHSREMLRVGYFEHESANGEEFWKRVERYYGSNGYARWQVGETLLWYSPDVTAAAAVDAWMHSPPHRKIILTPAFRELGVASLHTPSAPGSYAGDEVTVITADFGLRSGGRAPARSR